MQARWPPTSLVSCALVIPLMKQCEIIYIPCAQNKNVLLKSVTYSVCLRFYVQSSASLIILCDFINYVLLLQT